MKFSGTINHYYKDSPKGYQGLVRVTERICKSPAELGDYLAILVLSAVEFALDCGISTEEANASINWLGEYLKGIKIKEVKE